MKNEAIKLRTDNDIASKSVLFISVEVSCDMIT